MCVAPIHIYRKRDNGAIQDCIVPCGTCSECVKKKARSWGIRAYRETLVSPTNHFVTLTYDEFNVPRTSKGHLTLDRSSCTLFIKSLRTYMWYHYKCTFRFMLSAEYGSKTFRPHYHFLFHGLPSSLTLDEIESICRKLWKKCTIIDVQYPKNSSSSGFYLGKYCGKSVSSRIAQFVKEDPEFCRPFHRASLGYGNNFTKQEKDYFLVKSKQDKVFHLTNAHNPFYKDSSEFFRLCDLYGVDPYSKSIYDNMDRLSTARKLSEYIPWLNEVLRRYMMCTRPKTDGSIVNCQMPDYLAEKLYGKDLLRFMKRVMSTRRERVHDLCTDASMAVLNERSYAAKHFNDWFLIRHDFPVVVDHESGEVLEFRYQYFDTYLERCYIHDTDTTAFRETQEHLNLINLYSKDIF